MKQISKLIVVLAVAGSIQLGVAGSRTISASTEASGNEHPGTTAVKGPATVTCLTANQGSHNAGDPPAKCFVTGPGVSQQVAKGANVGTTGAGTVTLTCNGIAPLNCSAKVDD